LFKDSWRPEDKALESAEEEALERDYGDEIARARRAASTYASDGRIRKTSPTIIP
jgi:hypothetical protein